MLWPARKRTLSQFHAVVTRLLRLSTTCLSSLKSKAIPSLYLSCGGNQRRIVWGNETAADASDYVELRNPRQIRPPLPTKLLDTSLKGFNTPDTFGNSNRWRKDEEPAGSASLRVIRCSLQFESRMGSRLDRTDHRLSHRSKRSSIARG